MKGNKNFVAILILVVGLIGFQAFFILQTCNYTSEKLEINLQELLYEIADEIIKNDAFKDLINRVVNTTKLNDKELLNTKLKSVTVGSVFNEDDVVFEIFENKFNQSFTNGFYIGNIKYNKENFDKIKQHHFCLTCVLQNDFSDKETYLELGATIKHKNRMLLQAVGLPIFLSILFMLMLTFLAINILKKLNKAKALNTQKDDFINNLTHELKTPIFSISMLSGLISQQIKRGKLTDKIEGYNNLIKQEATHLQKHIERILNFSKTEFSDNQFKNEKVEIAALIKSIESLYIARAKAEACIFTVKKLTDDVNIIADEIHLKNVINALLDNAFKYSKSVNNSTINLEFEVKEGKCWIYIIDNGCGISNEEKERVFDKFYRIETGNVHDVKGFGLGLAYVKIAVNKMGGFLRIEDKKPQGTIVKLCFELEK